MISVANPKGLSFNRQGQQDRKLNSYRQHGTCCRRGFRYLNTAKRFAMPAISIRSGSIPQYPVKKILRKILDD